MSEAPKIVIYKNIDASQNWHVVVPDAMTTSQYLNLNDESGLLSYGSGSLPDPTSSVFSTLYSSETDVNGSNFIAYLWHDVPGLQKFGSYLGEGTTDGPFIELGFRPRFLIVKNITDGGRRWVMIDTKRYPINGPQTPVVWADYASAQSTTAENQIDILSNGFKWRYNNGNVNASGKTYIYMAWAEAPAFNMFGASSNAH